MSTLKSKYVSAPINGSTVEPLILQTNNLDRVTVDSVGNVGIGTSSPDQYGRTLSAPSATQVSFMAGNGGTAGYPSFGFSGQVTANGGRGAGMFLPTDNALAFSTTGSERMRIQANGNVGIGTNAPGQRLTISDSNSSNQLAVGGSQQNGMQFLNAAGGSGFIIGRSITVNDANNFFIYDAAATATRIVIDSSGSTQFLNGNVMPYQGAPTSKAAAATITGAELVTGILNTTGTTYTITLPTGANIEAAQTWWGVNTCLDWFVINTATGTITIAANGNTTLGALTIPTATSAHFRIRRTAANTFTVYRLR
jgi:hypothetical protein